MKPFKLINVYKWNSLKDKKLYTFNDNDEPFIYSDDNLEDAINKIALTIKEQDSSVQFPFYAWADNKSLLFKIDNIKWSGYNINPFKSLNRESKELDEPINYSFNSTELFNYKDINIIFSNDIRALKNNKYYFIEKKLPTIQQYKKRNKILSTLIDVNLANISESSINYHRYDLIGSLKSPINLSEIFDSLSTSHLISLIQWVHDPFKILYKLYKKHNITVEQLTNWTNIDKNTSNKYINVYSLLNNYTYCKITIEYNGLIHFSYNIDLRKGVNWDDIQSHKEIITKQLEFAIKQPIQKKLIEKSIKLNLQYEQINSNIDLLIKKLGEYIDIFQIIKAVKSKDKYIINCIYKRSSSYNKQGLDISSYIKSRLEIGISKNDLLFELMNLDIKKDEGIQLIDEQIDLLATDVVNEKDNYNKKIDTIITIELYKNGYLVNIYNIPSKVELEYLKFWLIRILSVSRELKPSKKNLVEKIKLPTPPPSIASSRASSKSSLSSIGEVDENIDLDLDFSGGALGKEKHSYFINLLKQADKNLFANYARKGCQAGFQPIVLSDAQLNKLKETKSDYFDNIIRYGSEESIKNNYACPRLWCPQSKIPLDPSNPTAKCPGEDEEVMELFFDKDKNKKRYVTLKKPNDNGICAPCCAIKKPKEEDLSKCKFYGESLKQPKKEEEQPKELEENYIVNQAAPITIGRYGVIPQVLHELLSPKVNYEVCSKVLNKSEKCFVRKGIKHKYGDKNDSIIYAIINNLKFKSKKAFIDDVKSRLDLITYISLENGEVCKAFMDQLPLIPEEHPQLLKEMKKLIDNKFFDINDDINYNKSRLLNIYNSYLKFIDYLNADDYPDNKSAYYLYSLLGTLYNVLLVIWEKSDKDVKIMCPYYTCFQDIIEGLKENLNPSILMLIKEKNYYEPIELKLRSSEGEKLIKLNDFPNIKKLIHQCSSFKESYNYNNKIYSSIYSLNQLMSKFDNSKKFVISTIIINNNMTIDHFLTKGNIMLITKPISISFLPKIISDLNITKILFYDDIVGKSFKIRINAANLQSFGDKLKQLDIESEIGTLNEGFTINSPEYHSTLVIPPTKLGNNIIHARVIDELYNSTNKTTQISKKWYQLHLFVTKILLNKLDDTKIKELQKEKRNVMIEKLMKLFEKYPDKNKIQVILEELPLYSLKHIIDYTNDVIYYYKYYGKYNSSNIIETKLEFIFSQLALLYGIPRKLLLYHKSTPNNNLLKPITEEYIINNKEVKELKLPELFNGTFEKLKSKWIMHKKSKWTNMVIIKTTNYSKELLKELYEWLANLLNIKIDYDEVEKLQNKKLREILMSKNQEHMIDMLDDTSYFNEWNSKISRNYKTVQIFWDRYYSQTSQKEHLDLLNTIISDNKLYPNDITILAICELLNINILTIHRGKYGKSSTDLIRGDVYDLVLSSTFCKANNNMETRPLLILHKSHDTTKSIYNLIVDNTDTNSIYMQYKDVPQNIKYLIEEHMKFNK